MPATSSSAPRRFLRAAAVCLLALGLVAASPVAAAPAKTIAKAGVEQAQGSAKSKRRTCERRARSLKSRARRRAALAACRRGRVTSKSAPTALRGPRPFEVGLVNSVWHDPRVMRSLRPRVVRLEFAVGTPVAGMRKAFTTFADAGIRILPLAGFARRLPTAEETRGLREWALEYGPGGSFWAARGDDSLAIRDIEFGNETNLGSQYGDQYDHESYKQRARDYGRRALEAIDALEGTRVGLLVQGTDGGTGSSNWIQGITSAAPGLAARVSAWTVHTYKPDWRGEMDRTVRQLAEAGTPSTVPFAVTETGYATAGGRCLEDNYGNDRCMSYDEAATALNAKVSAMRAEYGPRIESVFLYMERDLDFAGPTTERERYFGVLRSDGSDKGAYTQAARDLFAGRGPAA